MVTFEDFQLLRHSLLGLLGSHQGQSLTKTDSHGHVQGKGDSLTLWSFRFWLGRHALEEVKGDIEQVTQ